MKESYYNMSFVLKCLNKFATSPVFDDLILISVLPEEEWNEFESELKTMTKDFLERKDLC